MNLSITVLFLVFMVLHPIISGEGEQKFAENSENVIFEDSGHDDDDDDKDSDNEWHRDYDHNNGEKRYYVVTTTLFDKCYGTWNGRQNVVDIEIRIRNINYDKDRRCNKKICGSGGSNLTIIADGKKYRTSIFYPDTYAQFLKGSITAFGHGYVTNGYFKGATVATDVKYINPDPEKCYSKAGVTRLESDFATIAFQLNDKNFFSCLGMSKIEISPGYTTE